MGTQLSQKYFREASLCPRCPNPTAGRLCFFIVLFCFFKQNQKRVCTRKSAHLRSTSKVCKFARTTNTRAWINRVNLKGELDGEESQRSSGGIKNEWWLCVGGKEGEAWRKNKGD